MVGIGTALALQERGHAVTLIDRKVPGLETSYGNAGVLQAEAMEPYAMPRSALTLLRYAAGLSNDFTMNWRDLPAMIPELAQYFAYSSPARHRAVARRYSALISRIREDHAPLIEASDAQRLIRKTGLGDLYRTGAALDSAMQTAETLADRYGLALRGLDDSALRKEESVFKGKIAGALIWDDSWSCTDPGALVSAYCDLFRTRGGRIGRGDANDLQQTATGWSLSAVDGVVQARHVIVALGPWSKDLARRFGYRVPMIFKRGYHTHLVFSDMLSRPYLDTENGYVMSSMKQGLRLTSGAQLVRMDRPQRRSQLDKAVRCARELLDEPLVETGPLWFGHRPCMPDMLPRVGRAPKHQGLWFNFGHGHQGFTLGPTTGRILAEMIPKQ